MEKATTQPRADSHARRFVGVGWGFLVKTLLMGVVNALGLMIALSAWNVESWAILGATIAVLIVANVVYFSPRALPLKYLLPGLLFLLVFQVFTMGYTGYVAFTNYGTGHAGNMQQAVDAALIQGERPVSGSPSRPIAIVRDEEGTIGISLEQDGVVTVGTADMPMTPVDGASVGDNGAPSEVPGWQILPRAELYKDATLQKAVTELRVPVSDDASAGSYRTREGSNATIYRSAFSWDPASETLTDQESGVVYHPDHKVGRFVSADGQSTPTGWYVNVGFNNFVRAVTDSNLAQPLLQVTVWTFAFALLSVVLSFFVGLFFALVFNDARLKGRKIIRTLLILPYAFPAFMSGLLWRGMLNSEFGVINDLFFFGSNINWLGDPWLAKASVLFVNVWLSYPYWLLVCTGALQSLSESTLEAATLDGASKTQRFSYVTLPLLLVSTAPLAISSFAFSFNNFTIIYMLSEGGPMFPGDSNRLGATDILISTIYKISGVQGGVADYGLASALSIVVFIIVGLISALAFRQTRKLEEFQ